MIEFLLYFTGLIFLLDAIAYGFFVDVRGAFISILSALMFYAAFKIAPKDELDESKVVGWDLGQGIDVENPDESKSANVVLDGNSLNLGALFVGGPGSGKSKAAGALKQHFVDERPGCGFASLEGKGDFNIYQDDVESGAKPDYFFSSELPHSDTMNVMDSPVDAVIDYLSRVLVGSESEYYGSAQKSALRKVIPLLKSFSVPCNLMDLWAILTVSDAADYILKKARNENVSRDVIATAEQYFESDEKERLQIIDGLLNKLYPFVSSVLKDRLNAYEPTLILSDAVAAGKRLYFHMPLSENSKAVATMVTEQFGVIGKDRQLDVSKKRDSFPLLFDDWGAFFYSNFGPITARLRSAGMPVNFFFQSRGQTDAVEIGRIFTTEITDNIGMFIGFRINGVETANWVSDQFGSYESQALSKSENSSTNSGSNVSEVERPRVRADQLRDLNAGEAFVNVFITGAAGAMRNKRYRIRFPLAENRNERPSGWPVIEAGRDNDECDGLHLWRDFMDKDRLAEIKKAAIQDALNVESDEEDPTFDEEEIEYL